MLWVCRRCTASYAPGSERCPQCGANDHYDQGSEEDLQATAKLNQNLELEDQMPKISAAGGPTIEGVPGLDNQSDREEDRADFLGTPESGGVPSQADRIEQAEADRAAGLDPAEEARRRREGDNPDDTQRQDDAGEGDPEREGQQPSPDDYADWTYSDVKSEAKRRGLTATGSRDDLVDRLVESDRTEQRQG